MRRRHRELESRLEWSTYYAWQNMNTRCRNPNTKNYRHYGGRGISICPRWNDFDLFFSDMGTKPTFEHSLDRIDRNGNYEPTNCRWTTKTIQMKNRRRRQPK